ncbi:MAG: NADH-quinone oxidoreductase subunit NuoG [Candidatus Brocadiia bacterium]
MPTIFVDDAPYQVEDGQNLLQACLSLGFDIPYFCWHPAMHSVGACRQCAVKQFRNAEDKKGRIVMACMTPAAEGTRISIDDPDAVAFRKLVAELLMTNHPHDCPICDEGGECHLQDMTVMTGQTYRRFRFEKRTHRNQNLGPFVNHEMNRCIACYRCVRFYRDYAGGRDLEALGAHHYVYFGRERDGALESEFSGNLVEVCPTGVFTDKTLKEHYTRKWDMQTAPSICVHCGLGCNTIPGERYGLLRCVRNRFNGQVNGYFLCDRGRYGYEFVNSPNRIRRPLRRGDAAEKEEVTRESALQYLGEILRRDRQRVIGIGSPRASLEANFALRTLVGPERFFAGLSERDHDLMATAVKLLRESPARTPSLQEVAQADAALVLGENVPNVAPMLAFSLRQVILQGEIRSSGKVGIPRWEDAAVRDSAARFSAVPIDKAPLFVSAPTQTRLRDIAALTAPHSPDDAARLGYAVAHALSPGSPAVPDLPAESLTLAEQIAGTLMRAERPIVVSGPGCGSETVMQAAAAVARALLAAGRNAALCFTAPECNSVGLAMMGAAGGIASALKAAQDGGAEALIVLENDLYRRADAASVDALLHAARHVIVLDHLVHATAARSEMALPAATFAESEGTLVNNEGRAQRFFKVLDPGSASVRESWRWLRDIGRASGFAEFTPWRNLDDVMAAMARELPCFGAVPGIAPPAGFRTLGRKIPRQPHRYSGRTAMHADSNVHEPQPPDDPDSALAFSMEGFSGEPPPALIPRFWAPGWNSVQSVAKFQDEAGGPLHGGDPGRRLIEPSSKPAEATRNETVPPAFKARAGEWLVVPLYHVFGSEELSVLSRGVAELTPKPYLALRPEDLKRLGAADGDEIELTLNGAPLRLPARSWPTLANGLAGWPVGLPGMPAVSLPAWAALRRKATAEDGRPPAAKG